jgi:hypothetical protein
MSHIARKYFLLPAERDEVKQGISMFLLAKADSDSAIRDLSVFGASGITWVPKRGYALSFSDAIAARTTPGLCMPFYAKDLDCWIAVPDRRTSSGRKIAEVLETASELREILQWSLEKSLGIYGVVLGGYPTAFHYCVATPLFDGRVVVSTPDVANRPRGDGYSRNFEDPVIPDWAVEITADDYNALHALPRLDAVVQSVGPR